MSRHSSSLAYRLDCVNEMKCDQITGGGYNALSISSFWSHTHFDWLLGLNKFWRIKSKLILMDGKFEWMLMNVFVFVFVCICVCDWVRVQSFETLLKFSIWFEGVGEWTNEWNQSIKWYYNFVKTLFSFTKQVG